MWNEISGIAHFLFAIFGFMYGIIFRKNPCDWVFLILSFLVLIHWAMLNGECFITYFHKIKEEPDYTPGSAAMDLSDMYVLGINPQIIQTIMGSLLIVWAASIYLVMQRNGFSFPLIVFFLLFFFVYNGSLRFFNKHYENPNFHIVQHACLVAFVVVAVFVVQRLWRMTRRR